MSVKTVGRFILVLSLLLCITKIAAGAQADESQLLQELRTQRGTNANSAAEKLGRLGSVDGLKALIAIGNEELFSRYGAGLTIHRWGLHAPLDPELESLLVQYYRTPNVSQALAESVIAYDAKYQSRELFDQFYIHLLEPGQTDNTSRRWALIMTTTDLAGIEPQLLDALPRLPGQGQLMILIALGNRRYVPAIPPLEAMLQSQKHDSYDESRICDALTRIGTKESVDIVVKHIATLIQQLPSSETGTVIPRSSGMSVITPDQILVNGKIKARDNPDPAVVNRILRALQSLSTMPTDAPLDLKALKHVLPSNMKGNTTQIMIALIKRRHDQAGVPDLLGYLQDSAHRQEALDALLDFDSREVWRQTKEMIDRIAKNGPTDQFYATAENTLSERLKNSEVFLANKRKQERDRALMADWFKLGNARRAMMTLQQTRPDQFVKEFEKSLVESEHFLTDHPDARPSAANQELAQGYLVLGDVARFTLSRPDQAIAFYQKSSQFNQQTDQNRRIALDLRLADTYEYDLKDTGKAISYYQSVLDISLDVSSHTAPGNQFGGLWQTRWVTNEITYLKTGKPFSSTIDKDTVASFYLSTLLTKPNLQVPIDTGLTLDQNTGLYKADPGLNRTIILQKLQRLPHSHLVLSATLQALSYLPTPESMLAYLEAQDQGRYWSAVIFGLVALQKSLGVYFQYSLGAYNLLAGSESMPLLLPGADSEMTGATNPLQLAAEQFQKRTHVHVAMEADKQFANPEQTWDHFLISLKAGDLQAALSCLTPIMRSRFLAQSPRLSPEEMQQMARSFTAFALQKDMGRRKEYVVTQTQGGRNAVTSIYFINSFGEWKIQDM